MVLWACPTFPVSHGSRLAQRETSFGWRNVQGTWPSISEPIVSGDNHVTGHSLMDRIVTIVLCKKERTHRNSMSSPYELRHFVLKYSKPWMSILSIRHLEGELNLYVIVTASNWCIRNISTLEDWSGLERLNFSGYSVGDPQDALKKSKLQKFCDIQNVCQTALFARTLRSS